MSALISIIVPVYNMAPYLDRCVRSITAQEYNNLEILLVDDGSTDDSGALCDRWERADPRITVFHKPNGGLLSAWKYGVTRSHGTYIGFVDADDWIEPDMYARLYASARAAGADIACCGWVLTAPDGTALSHSPAPLPSGVYHAEDLEERVFPTLFCAGDYRTRLLSPSRADKLFRRPVLLSAMTHTGDSVSIGEDLLTTFSALLYTRTLVVDAAFFPYHYLLNPESMVHAYSDSKYDKLSLLRRSLLAVDQCHSCDFTLQINTDFLKLMLSQMEEEILFSGRPRAALKRSMAALYRRPDFRAALEHSEFRKLPLKYRAYLFFLRHHLYEPAILMRRAKSRFPSRTNRLGGTYET